MLIKAAAAGAVGAVICLLIKKDSPGIALLLAAAAGMLIMYLALDVFADIMDFAGEISETAGVSKAVIAPVIKTVGIGILTRIASDICKDAGQGSIAASVELAGAVSAVYVALPLMKTTLRMIKEFL